MTASGIAISRVGTRAIELSAIGGCADGCGPLPYMPWFLRLPDEFGVPWLPLDEPLGVEEWPMDTLNGFNGSGDPNSLTLLACRNGCGSGCIEGPCG